MMLTPLQLPYVHHNPSCNHRRSQGGQRGHAPPKCLENIVIFCFERRFSKRNSVIRLISNILAAQNFWVGYATACDRCACDAEENRMQKKSLVDKT